MVWQFLARNLIHKMAAEKVGEAINEAAQSARARTDEAGDSESAEDLRCDVAVIFSRAAEMGAMIDLLSGPVRIHGHGFKVHRGDLAGRRVVVVESGPGIAAAARATQAVIDGHSPQWLIAAGFASALADDVQRGNIIMADSVADAGGRRLTIDLAMDPESAASMRGLLLGRLLTLDELPRDTSEKQELATKHEALAADTASFAVLDVCREAKVRCLAVRIVSDAVADQLPADIERLMEEKSIARKLGAATGTIWRRPSSVKDWWQIREDALKSADRLAKFLASMIAQLVPAEKE
jgi:adenosylhomocysteine nucleosidase